MIIAHIRCRETGDVKHSFSFTEDVIPNDMSYFDFVRDYLTALAQYEHVEWNFDFTKATPTEAQCVERADIIARVQRAFREGRQINCCDHCFLIQPHERIKIREDKLMRRHLSSFGKKFNFFNQDGDLGIVVDNHEFLIIGKVVPIIRLH